MQLEWPLPPRMLSSPAAFAQAPLLAHHTCFTLKCMRRPSWCMSDAGSAQQAKKPRRKQFVSGAVGRQAQADAIVHADGDLVAVADMCAAGVLEAFSQTYSKETHPMVFVVCGHGFNGLVGARAAGLLKDVGYRPTVYLQKGSVLSSAGARGKSLDVSALLKDMGLSTCDFVPSTLDFYYDVIVDALLGVGFDGGDIQSRYWGIFKMLLDSERPILSIDMPSGWDLDKGPRQIDVAANTFLRPEVLVSLGVPKDGTKVFAGAFHFIGGRHLPEGWLNAREVSLPAWSGKDSSCALLSSNPFPDQGNTGEAYGKSGKFEATLWDGREGRIKWVSEEEMLDNDLWDELD